MHLGRFIYWCKCPGERITLHHFLTSLRSQFESDCCQNVIMGGKAGEQCVSRTRIKLNSVIASQSNCIICIGSSSCLVIASQQCHSGAGAHCIIHNTQCNTTQYACRRLYNVRQWPYIVYIAIVTLNNM